VLPPDFVLPRENNFSAKDVARARVVFFGETEGNDKVLPVPRPNSSGVAADEDSSEEISDDVDWLVRAKAPPPEPRETLLNLRRLENVGDFVGSLVLVD
jgi:hypothetical protein